MISDERFEKYVFNAFRLLVYEITRADTVVVEFVRSTSVPEYVTVADEDIIPCPKPEKFIS